MEYKKIDLTGLEGKNREFAEVYNSMVEDLQAKSTTIKELETKMAKLQGLEEKMSSIEKLELDGLDGKMAEMKNAIKELEQKANDIATATVDTFEQEMKSFFESAEYKSLSKPGTSAMFELKAAELMKTALFANVPALGRQYIDPVIHSSPRERNAIYNRVVKGMVSAPTIKWVNRVNKEGGAAFIAEGTIKPLMDWEYKEETATPKKIAVAAKISTEMLEDYEFMRSEIRRMLTEELIEQIDIKLLTGAGGNEPTGMITLAGGYTQTTLDGTIVMPNDADAIRAAMLQMRLLNYYPDMVFLNPSEVARIDLTKSSTGNYIKLEVEGVLRSLQVVETARIDAGKFLLIDSSKWNVRPYNTITVQFGWENDDFRKNLVTVICEQRIYSYINSIDTGAFTYGELAAIKAALEVKTAAAA